MSKMKHWLGAKCFTPGFFFCVAVMFVAALAMASPAVANTNEGTIVADQVKAFGTHDLTMKHDGFHLSMMQAPDTMIGPTRVAAAILNFQSQDANGSISSVFTHWTMTPTSAASPPDTQALADNKNTFGQTELTNVLATKNIWQVQLSGNSFMANPVAGTDLALIQAYWPQVPTQAASDNLAVMTGNDEKNTGQLAHFGWDNDALNSPGMRISAGTWSMTGKVPLAAEYHVMAGGAFGTGAGFASQSSA